MNNPEFTQLQKELWKEALVEELLLYPYINLTDDSKIVQWTSLKTIMDKTTEVWTNPTLAKS